MSTDCDTHEWLEEAEAIYDHGRAVVYITLTCNVCAATSYEPVRIHTAHIGGTG